MQVYVKNYSQEIKICLKNTDNCIVITNRFLSELFEIKPTKAAVTLYNLMNNC